MENWYKTIYICKTMKKLIFLEGMCCLTSIILIHLPLLANVPLIRVRRNQIRCEPQLGRIISKGDRRFEVGSLICKGDKLEVLNGGSVEFLCFSSGKFLKIPSGTIPIDKCAESEQASSPCNPSNTDGCRIQKGGTEGSDEPTIISPYSTSTLNSRPEIIWTAVRGATDYKIKVTGYEFQWDKIVNKTQLDYPTDEKELQAGNTYRIDVFACREDGYPFASRSRAITLLSVADQEEIAQKVKRIKELGLPPDEAALDVDTIYTSRNLLNETIEVLKARAAALSRNPTLYRVLGDRYLEAWLPNEAKREYTKAAFLAKSSNNSTELQKVQERLKLLESQQP